MSTGIGQWLAQVQSGEMPLAELAKRLNQRGAIEASRHQSELAMMDALLQRKGIDPRLHGAVRRKLLELQKQVSPTTTGTPAKQVQTQIDDDATQLLPSVTARPTSTTNSSGTWHKLAKRNLPTQDIGIGTRLKDRFVLEKKLGSGGMGVVYLATDERKVEARDRDPHIAIKVLNDAFRHHPDSLVALQREARRTQELAHENIVRVYDFDKDGSVVFMTMEYVRGDDLKQLIRRLGGAPMPLRSAYPIIRGIGSALSCAHRRAVVHSDLKPGNVILDQHMQPKVFDFGIARAAHDSEAHARAETTRFDPGSLGALTPAYASLEMLQSQPADPADDVYALACISYELLGGRHPFNKRNARKAQTEQLVAPRIEGLSNRQWRTLKRGLAFRREDRIPSADAFVEGMQPRAHDSDLIMRALLWLGIAAAVAILTWLLMTPEPTNSGKNPGSIPAPASEESSSPFLHPSGT